MNSNARKIIDEKLDALMKSKFRSSFKLRKRECEIIEKYGFEKVGEHGRYFIEKNLLCYDSLKDGKQTPMRNHPFFIAQHATGTCCRGCLYKWHKISCDKKLSNNEINYIVALNMEWIKRRYYTDK